ncbi:MAG: Formiminotransferase-cyclodeaminase [Actinomycetota bacterium]
MAPARPFLELTLGEWLEELAAARAVPGAGSALAFALSTAAAVVAMAARVSKESWENAGAAAAQAAALQARAAPLAQLDAYVYERALSAREGAAELRPEQRDWQIGQAFARAAEPPLEIARTAADVAELAAEVAASCEPRVRADAQAAAALAAGAARGAAALVAVNLTAVDNDPRVVEAGRLVEAAETAAGRARAAER